MSTSCRAAEKLTLDGCVIVTDPDLPSYVQYAVAGPARLPPGNHGCGAARHDVIGWPAADVAILVGPQSAQQVLGATSAGCEPHRDGYILKSVSAGRQALSWWPPGLGARHEIRGGTADEDAACRREIRAGRQPGGHGQPARLCQARHALQRLGVRLSLHVSRLARSGLAAVPGHPVVPGDQPVLPVAVHRDHAGAAVREDQAYLEECRRVVEYAQQKHGMEVWIMQCTNRVARDRCGVEDPRLRPYWRPSQEDLNPGNPEHFQAIMASREALYRIVNNVDGVCNIDSDPGAYAGSPLSDYLKVLRGCRDLLDRHNLHGKQTKLVNWMWCGWGLPPRTFDPAIRSSRSRACGRSCPSRGGWSAARFRICRCAASWECSRRPCCCPTA